MPLDTEKLPFLILVLDALDDPVFGPGDGAESFGEAIDRLVMDRVDQDVGLPRRLSDLGIRCDRHRLVPVVYGVADDGMVLGANGRRYVLGQGSTEGGVDYLDPTANGQHRHPALVGSLNKGKLEFIPIEVGPPRLFVAFLAVAKGLHIPAPRQDEAVDTVKEERNILVWHRDERYREPSGAEYRVGVGVADDVRVELTACAEPARFPESKGP